MAVNKDGVYIAEDKDFRRIDGYWIYKGKPLEVDITDFVNSKNLTLIRHMFRGSSTYGSTAVKRVVLGKNSVTDMRSMFVDSRATSLDLSSFDTSSVTNMSYMFNGSQATTGYARTQADADKFNSSSGKPEGLVFVVKPKDGVYIAEDKDFQDINGYWIYKGEPLEVDITDFVNSKNLTSTRYMFSGSSTYNSTAVKRVVLGKNSVTDMNSMFSDSQATSLDLSSFDTSNVNYMSYMFSGSQATSLDLSSFDTSSVTYMTYMFYYSQATTGYARTQADADKFNSSSGKPSGLVFVVKFKDGVYIAEDKDFQDINGYWIYKGEPLEVDITDFVNSKNLTSIRYMFSGSSTYNSTAVKRVVLGKNSVTDMRSMFVDSRATSLDLSSFDTSSVTNMSYMFNGSQATTGYARTQADADKFNSSSGKPSGLVFVVKPPSFGRLNNLKIKSVLHKDSNGMIKQVKTLKYKDNLGNITKLK